MRLRAVAVLRFDAVPARGAVRLRAVPPVVVLAREAPAPRRAGAPAVRFVAVRFAAVRFAADDEAPLRLAADEVARIPAVPVRVVRFAAARAVVERTGLRRVEAPLRDVAVVRDDEPLRAVVVREAPARGEERRDVEAREAAARAGERRAVVDDPPDVRRAEVAGERRVAPAVRVAVLEPVLRVPVVLRPAAGLRRAPVAVRRDAAARVPPVRDAVLRADVPRDVVPVLFFPDVRPDVFATSPSSCPRADAPRALRCVERLARSIVVRSGMTTSSGNRGVAAGH